MLYFYSLLTLAASTGTACDRALISQVPFVLGKFIRSQEALPSSRVNPMYICTALRPRPDLDTRPFFHNIPVLLPLSVTTKAPTMYAFRGSITKLLYFLSTLRANISIDYARLGSGCWSGFAGWDWLPTGLLRRVSNMYICLQLSPLHRLNLAQHALRFMPHNAQCMKCG